MEHGKWVKVGLIQQKLIATLNNMEDNADIKEYADQINKVFLQSDVNEGLKKDLKRLNQ